MLLHCSLKSILAHNIQSLVKLMPLMKVKMLCHCYIQVKLNFHINSRTTLQQFPMPSN
jgi:hypothetical protein